MSIIKTDKTNYYELDWYVPTENNDKVYMAIKGEIESNTALSIMSDGVGYEWTEEENSKFKKIPENEFFEKATKHNIVYFYEDKNNYNALLNYPKELQKSIDLELYRDGFKPHNRISLKDKLQILKSNVEVKKNFKAIEKNIR